MTTEETLKMKYRERKLAGIEAIAFENRDKSIAHRKDFIMALYYLQFTRRFRENPAYKKESFETYINDMFVLRIGTFNQERWAFIKHEAATMKHGPGIITKIKKTCGSMNVKKVVAEINGAARQRKTPLPRNKKEAIILTYALPVKEKPYRESRTALNAKIAKLEKDNREKDKMIIEKDEQIVKLKATIATLKAKEQEFAVILGPISEYMGRGVVAAGV